MRLPHTLLLTTAALCAAGLADAKPDPAAVITEVRAAKNDAEDTSVLIKVADKLKTKLRSGQSLEIRRAGKTIGYGSVDKVFSNVVVATVGTIVDDEDPPKAGDAVTFLASGFKKGPEARRPAPALKPKQKKILGKVVGVRDGIVLLDMGSKGGLETGHLVVLRDPKSRAEVGRIKVELLGDTSGGGMILSGSAKVGLEALVVGKVGKSRTGEPGIDFVKLDFLGCVADIEHPSPHRAPCHVGVPVRRILRGSPAEKSGIGRGDRIISVDGIVVRDIASVRKRIQARASARVRILLMRGDRLIQIDVDFGRR